MPGLSNPRPHFGIHSVLAYNRSTYVPYGVVRVVGGGEISLQADPIDLFGGSNKYPWASQAGRVESQFSFTIREFPNFVYELFLGGSTSTTATEASGAVSTPVEFVGTSLIDATTGIATITVVTAADLKYGRLVFIAASATTVRVYYHAQIDEIKGSDLTFITDTLEITGSPFTITSGGDTTLTNTGLKFTGGSGAIAVTTGHVAYVDVRPPHTGQDIISIGQSGSTFPEFGARMLGEKQSDGRIFEIHALRANASGMPIGLTENEWAEAEVTMKLLYDSTANKVFDIIEIDES